MLSQGILRDQKPTSLLSVSVLGVERRENGGEKDFVWKKLEKEKKIWENEKAERKREEFKEKERERHCVCESGGGGEEEKLSRLIGHYEED